MNETRHVRLDYEEALSAKKQLLSSEINLLHTIKNVKAYTNLRTKEMIYKTKLRNNLNILKTKLSLFQSTFPKQESKEKIPKKKNKIEEAKNKDLQKELEEIRSKLSKLN